MNAGPELSDSGPAFFWSDRLMERGKAPDCSYEGSSTHEKLLDHLQLANKSMILGHFWVRQGPEGDRVFLYAFALELVRCFYDSRSF